MIYRSLLTRINEGKIHRVVINNVLICKRYYTPLDGWVKRWDSTIWDSIIVLVLEDLDIMNNNLLEIDEYSTPYTEYFNFPTSIDRLRVLYKESLNSINPEMHTAVYESMTYEGPINKFIYVPLLNMLSNIVLGMLPVWANGNEDEWIPFEIAKPKAVEMFKLNAEEDPHSVEEAFSRSLIMKFMWGDEIRLRANTEVTSVDINVINHHLYRLNKDTNLVSEFTNYYGYDVDKNMRSLLHDITRFVGFPYPPTVPHIVAMDYLGDGNCEILNKDRYYTTLICLRYINKKDYLYYISASAPPVAIEHLYGINVKAEAEIEMQRILNGEIKPVFFYDVESLIAYNRDFGVK